MFTATLEVPIEKNADGVWRLGGTRVTMDTLMAAFAEGATAEEIALRYPSLKLADIYAAISFILRNQVEVEFYLQQRHQQAEEIRAQNEARFETAGIRSRLLARRVES